MKSKITILFIFLFQQIFAQTPKIDSLLNVVENSNGKTKIIALSDVSKYMYNQNQDKGIEYGNQALQLAETEKMPELKCRIYNSIGLNYYVKAEYKTARSYFEKALKESLYYNDSNEVGMSYNRMGLIYEIAGDYDSALVVFKKEFEIYKKINKIENIGNTSENIATIHYHRGELKSALTYFIEAKEFYEKYDKKSALVLVKSKIAAVYCDLKEYAQAEEYYNEALKYYTDNKDNTMTGTTLNSLGVLYKQQNKYEEALKFYNQALDAIKGTNSFRLELIIYSNLGAVYANMGKYETAITFHKKSLELSIKINYKSQIAINNHNIGETYNILNQFSNAKIYLESARQIFDSMNVSNNLITNYKQLIISYNGLKDYEKSVKYYQLFINLNDSLNEVEKNISLDSLQTVYKTNEVEKENEILEQKTELQHITISNQQTLIFLGVIITLLLLSLTIIILQNRKKIKNANLQLEHKNEVITQKAEELQTLNDKLVELDNFKAGLMQMIVHDLKNPLNNLLNIEVFRTQLEQNVVVKQTSQLMLNLVQDILDVYKYEKTKMKLEIESVSALELIDLAHKEVAYLLENKSLKLEKIIPQEIGIKCDKQIILRVLTNLLTNAIKYSPNNSQIKIEVLDIKNDNHLLELSIIDQGIGIPKEYEERIFEKFVQLNVAKNEKIRSTGLGLSFCKLAVESHGGKIKTEPMQEMGTKFVFTVPKTLDFNTYKQNEDEIKQTKFNFSEDELNYLLQFISELNQIPIYKISLLNNILTKIKTQTSSEKIIKWCDYIYQTALNGNNEKYLELQKYSKN